MTSQALNRPVDVLVELVAIHQRAWNQEMERQRVAGEPVSHIKATRAALAALGVAELIEAGRDLQDAMDEDDSNPFNPGPAARFHAADARHRAALAAIGSQP